MRNLIKLLTILFASLVFFGCAGAPPRPEGKLGQVNARSHYIREYDFANFDSDIHYSGTPLNRGIEFDNLQGYWCMDSASKESLQAYSLKWKQRYLDLKSKCEKK